MRSLIAALISLMVVSLAQAREEISLDQGWRFIQSDTPNAADILFNDSSWESVDLPHTWNATDATGGVNSYYRGIGWYRRHIQLASQQMNLKQIYLWFGAAGSAAEVYVNGQNAGAHKGAFGAFCFDIRSLVTIGDNVISVKVNNAADPSIAPLSGDFNIEGGLYRNAKLIVTESVAVSPLDHASSGVYVRQTRVSDDKAELEISTLLRNIEPAPVSPVVKIELVDASGKTVATTQAEHLMNGGSTRVVQNLSIDKPRLWNGKIDPYLYRIDVEVSESGNVTDRLSVPVGLRYFKVDPAKGFILNGKPYDLHGVNRHQDFGKKGWAITQADMQVDMDLIKEMGCTMLRLPHYQHSPLFYDLCDRNGLVVWAELCQVNRLGTDEAFAEVSKQQLNELIKQNFNHPSICFWSLYNELNFAGGEQDLKLLNEENAIAHELDSTRLTTAASNRKIESPGHWIPDLIGLNVYYGWYADQQPPDWKSGLDRIVSFKPDRAVGISEYGAGGSVVQHEIPSRRPSTTGRWHPEEYQTQVHEEGWKEMSGRRMWCRLVWVFADFPVANRREGDTVGMNDKGLVTNDRKTKKDAFYFYKANWSDEPVLYITSRRFTVRPEPKTPVRIYSNCDTVSLNVNGQPAGEKSSPDHVFVWENVSLKRGENVLTATASRDGREITDMSKITYDPTSAMQP
ncbi:MAG TPA: glycoside hydrolase family 2 TIM barrel-domain containing protein [Tepidisphaeraceae bacterium]|nr:glycoside hydrolase family 2 TIM barrel-domain containing protein [Tepidisphaeraceae bacterium]